MLNVWGPLLPPGTPWRLFFFFLKRPSQLDSGVWWRVGRSERAEPEVSFKGMFNFHSLFLKSNFLQRQEE
jgi:hypothetical protein